jgi:histidyl-tRNA synthetase
MKPSIPRGTRDFGPAEMQKRQYIFNILKSNFQLYGYAPIETPTMENIGTLTGKYGEEGDQLIFKVLNSRIHESKDDKKELLKKEFNTSLEKAYNTEQLTEKALRYDLTVPFARYVVMNHNNLTFPFKRYQIQPVWRADKPQKGRYREFYQCDADVIGSNSLINELELIAMMDKSFSQLNIPVVLKINNRKVLAGIADVIGAPERMIDIAIAIDKYDKIGKDGVEKELLEKGFSNNQISILNDALFMHNNKIAYGDKAIKDDHNRTRLNFLKNGSDYRNSKIFQEGITELEFIFNNLKKVNIKHLTIELDITLARGLNYYTGTIFEAKANAGTFTPSILGGGRYDDLTGIFGLKNMSGVGVSFGVDRIYDVMEELNLFPETVNGISTTKVLITNLGNQQQEKCLAISEKLRESHINCEVYPDPVKIGKQFDYAEKKQIPFVLGIDLTENGQGKLTLKNIQTGNKEEVSIEQLIEVLK